MVNLTALLVGTDKGPTGREPWRPWYQKIVSDPTICTSRGLHANPIRGLGPKLAAWRCFTEDQQCVPRGCGADPGSVRVKDTDEFVTCRQDNQGFRQVSNVVGLGIAGVLGYMVGGPTGALAAAGAMRSLQEKKADGTLKNMSVSSTNFPPFQPSISRTLVQLQTYFAAHGPDLKHRVLMGDPTSGYPVGCKPFEHPSGKGNS